MANSIGYYTQRVPLGAASFLLTMRYNARMDRWILDVADANANMLVRGLPILSGWSTTTRFKGRIPGLPAGLLIAMDQTGAQRDPQEDTFGGDVPLFYLE